MVWVSSSELCQPANVHFAYFSSHLCRILSKHSPLGAVCYRFYGLPLISDHIITIPIYWTAVLCVGLYHGAYIAEVIRSGIQSIPSGQMEAALSQGFTYISAMRLIILPQAFRIILLLDQPNRQPHQNTSTVAIISGVDLMFVTKSWSALNGNYIPAFLGAALLYFSLCFPVAQFGRKMEQANKNLFTLGGYYGIHFRSFDPR